MEVETEQTEQTETTSNLDEMINSLDGPELEGDIPEGEDHVDEDKDDASDESQKEEEDSSSEDEKKDDEAKSEDDAEDKDKDESVDKAEVETDPRDEEILNLRQKTRDQNKAIRELKSRVDKNDEKLIKSGLVEEEEEKDTEVDPLEEAQRIKLETLAETMKMSEKYSDLDEVVTEVRYDDLIESAVETLVKDKGYTEDDAHEAANTFIWSKPNPYRYLYEIIKKHHSDFKVEEKAEDKKEDAEDKEDKTEKKKQDVADSLSSLTGGGGEKDKGGWTTAKIDDLPEDKLNQVPQNIYDKYMKGTLD